MTERRWRRQRDEGWDGMVTIAAGTFQYLNIDRTIRIAGGQVLQSIDQPDDIIGGILGIPHWV